MCRKLVKKYIQEEVQLFQRDVVTLCHLTIKTTCAFVIGEQNFYHSNVKLSIAEQIKNTNRQLAVVGIQ